MCFIQRGCVTNVGTQFISDMSSMDQRRTTVSTNNSVAAMLELCGDSLVSSPSNTSSSPRYATATSSSSFILS